MIKRSALRVTKASKAKGKTGPDPVRQGRGQWAQKVGLSANPASQSDSVQSLALEVSFLV